MRQPNGFRNHGLQAATPAKRHTMGIRANLPPLITLSKLANDPSLDRENIGTGKFKKSCEKLGR